MSGHAEVEKVRPDVDIHADVMGVFRVYPPLRHDRERLEVTVTEGNVVVIGHVKTAQSIEVFARESLAVDGVTGVDVSQVYDDESIRLQVGRATPYGVYTSVSYGAVVLNGHKPADVSIEEMVEQVSKMDGVRKVITAF